MFQNKCHLLTGTCWTTLIILFGYSPSQPLVYEHILLLEIILFLDLSCPFITSHPLVRCDAWHRASFSAAMHPSSSPPHPTFCSLHFPSKPLLTLSPWSEPSVRDPHSKLLTHITVCHHTIICVIRRVMSSLSLSCILPMALHRVHLLTSATLVTSMWPIRRIRII